VKYLQEDSKKDKVTFIKNFFSKSFLFCIITNYIVLVRSRDLAN
jgi:hypothetical protein